MPQEASAQALLSVSVCSTSFGPVLADAKKRRAARPVQHPPPHWLLCRDGCIYPRTRCCRRYNEHERHRRRSRTQQCPGHDDGRAHLPASEALQPLWPRCRSAQPHLPGVPSPQPRQGQIANAALLRTCKEVHNEALGPIYEESTFSITADYTYLLFCWVDEPPTVNISGTCRLFSGPPP